MVSVNHRVAPGVVREPPPRGQTDLSNGRRFRANVFVANSGYQIRYPPVAATTVCCAGRRCHGCERGCFPLVETISLNKMQEKSIEISDCAVLFLKKLFSVVADCLLSHLQLIQAARQLLQARHRSGIHWIK